MAYLSSMFDSFDNHAAQILASLVLWATCLLGFAWLSAKLLARASSAVRYCVWQFSLLGLLVLPGIVALLPGVPLGFSWQRDRVTSASTNEVATTSDAPARVLSTISLPEPATAVRSESQTKLTVQQRPNDSPRQAAELQTGSVLTPIHSEPLSVPPEGLPTTTATAAPGKSWWIRLLVMGWICGVLAQTARLSWSLIQASRLGRVAQPLNDERFETALADLSRQLSVSRAVRLLASPDVPVPMVVGVRRAWILLPATCNSWSTYKIRIVLSHELAHVERQDLFWQLAARAAAALYWFHPLVWLAVRQMRDERERACDDRVLSAGVAPIDYAAGLVEVAAGLAGRRRKLVAGIGMAQRCDLEDRVRLILDPLSPRMRPRPVSAAGSGCRRLPSYSRWACFVRSARLPVVRLQNLPLKQPRPMGRRHPRNRPLRRNLPMPSAASRDKCQPTERCGSVWSMGAASRSPAQIFLRTSHIGTATLRHLPINGKSTTRTTSLRMTARRISYFPAWSKTLRIWVRRSGFAPLFSIWWAKQDPDLTAMPDEFTYHLQPGTLMGGIVRNDDGEPIKGVKVEVMYDDGGKPDPSAGRATFDTWLSNGVTAIRTDADGLWTLRNVPPGDDVQVRIKLSHPDYINDSNWGELQRQQFVTTRSLRDQTAEIVMHRGPSITGTVRVPGQKPVANAVVIWGDRPYFQPGSQEVRTNEQGVYTLPPLPNGQVAVTVAAEGWMPERRKITIEPAMRPVDFDLKPGKKLRVRFVDDSAAPVPDVYVGIGHWRGAESLYNHKHENVLDTKIPRSADHDGIYEWKWAPDDAVEYRFSKEGFAEPTATLTADDSEHVITMHRGLRIAGKVVDANTEKPIEKFLVVPIIYFRPDFPSVEHQDQVPCTGGQFDRDIDRADVEHGLQIKAHGYATLHSRPVSHWRSCARAALRTTPAERFIGQVLDEGGRPVSDSRVYVGSYSEHLYLSDLDKDDGGRSDNYRVKSGDDGRFEIAHQPERYCLVVVSPDGYGEADRQIGEIPGQIKLRSWAKLHGHLMQTGKPVALCNVRLDPLRDQGGDAPRPFRAAREHRRRRQLQLQARAAGPLPCPRIPPLVDRGAIEFQPLAADCPSAGRRRGCVPG